MILLTSTTPAPPRLRRGVYLPCQPSEHQPQGELNLPRLAVGRSNSADASIWRNAGSWNRGIRRRKVRIEHGPAGILERRMIQDVERFRAELNLELLGNLRNLPILGERTVEVPQIGTDDRVSSRIAVRT